MSPTSTEHDFRFPRRPADSGPGDMKAKQSERAASASTSASARARASARTNKKGSGAASPVANRSPRTTHRTNNNNNNNNKSKNTADMRGSLKEVRFDLSRTIDSARGTLSKTDAFAGFHDGIAGMSDSPTDLGKDDPLAAQVWRFFSKTKQRLPNQERMENLTWRMMHTSLRNQRLANDESSRYGCLAWCLRDASNGSTRCLALPCLSWRTMRC
jgi:GATA-binding protein, other eukaryote